MKKYTNLFFDCDGVILNSNFIKTNSFYEVTKKYGKIYADELVNYHIANGGVSRYKKFEYFLKNIIQNFDEKEYQILLDNYSNNVRSNLLKAEFDIGIHNIKRVFPNASNAIISGSDEKELNWIFKRKNIDHIFDYGIFGSPRNKKEIFDAIFSKFKGNESCIFFGDSEYDYLVSKDYEMDFIFIYEWTEFKDWENFINLNKIKTMRSISEFINAYEKD